MDPDLFLLLYDIRACIFNITGLDRDRRVASFKMQPCGAVANRSMSEIVEKEFGSLWSLQYRIESNQSLHVMHE